MKKRVSKKCWFGQQIAAPNWFFWCRLEQVSALSIWISYINVILTRFFEKFAFWKKINLGLLFVVQIELFRARGVQGRHFRSNLIKRKVWGSFFSPQIAKMCSLGPKKAPPDLTFHKGFAKLATLTEKCSPGDQFGLTIVDPNQFSKKRKIYQKFNQNGAYIAAPNQFSRKNIFSQKVFRFGSYIVMPNQWNLFCKNRINLNFEGK